jgi:hypothetical protein
MLPGLRYKRVILYPNLRNALHLFEKFFVFIAVAKRLKCAQHAFSRQCVTDANVSAFQGGMS